MDQNEEKLMIPVSQENYRLLSRKEAAEFLGIKEITLAIWKSTKRHQLPVVKVGRLVRYRLSDLHDFIERRTVNKPIDHEISKG